MGGSSYGAAPGLRWWMSEGVVLMPSLRLSISQDVDEDDPIGTVAPEVSSVWAAHDSATTRVGANLDATRMTAAVFFYTD